MLILKKANPEAYKNFVEDMKSNHALIAKSLGKSEGTSRFDGDDGSEDNDGESANDALERMTDELLAKNVEKGEDEITRAQAYTRIAKANPKLRVRARLEN